MNNIKSLLTFTLVFMFCFTSTAQENESSESHLKEYTIENCINEFTMDGIEKTKKGYRYWFVDKNFVDGRTIKLSVVKPNSATHPPHSHAEDEFFFVLEGKAEFHLNGKTKIVGPMTSFYCPPNSTHGIRNVGNTELKYLVLKKIE